MSVSDYLEEAWLKTLRGGGNGTSFTAPAAVYVKLHTGDPGDAGTANAAGETTRKAITYAAPATPGGTMASSALAEWTAVSTTETYSYISLWDASTAGNCLWTGALTTPRAVTAGDTFQLPSASVVLTLG